MMKLPRRGHSYTSHTVILILLLVGTLHAQEWPGVKDSLYSKAIGEMRRFQVVVPKDYVAGSSAKYEVLYMPDGEWYMEQIPFIYNFTVNAHFAPSNIFVLIPNTYVDGVNLRGRDYSPTRDQADSLSGGADNYHRFLKDELIPYIESKYPASKQERTLVGSSFSGLFALYAFFKDPDLFISVVASDPNVHYGNFHVARMAAEKLPGFSKVKSTLFFAGLQVSSRGMGNFQLDSIMRAHAPKGLRWKYVEYEDETHYSVQHKAFYDGFRFSHLGYTNEAVGIHPMAGILNQGMPLRLLVVTNPQHLRYTTDGTEPTIDSPPLKENIEIHGPGIVNMRSFPHRDSDIKTHEVRYPAGPLKLERSAAKKAELKYAVYEGKWTSLPDTRKLKPVQAGTVTPSFQLGQLTVKEDAAYVVQGTVQIDEPGYYVFVMFSGDQGVVTFGGKKFLDGPEYTNSQTGRSYVLPLEKGIYPIRVECFRKRETPGIAFSIFKSTAQQPMWWTQRLMGF